MDDASNWKFFLSLEAADYLLFEWGGGGGGGVLKKFCVWVVSGVSILLHALYYYTIATLYSLWCLV